MREIVGVVGDVHFDGPSKYDQDEVYLPYRQVPWPSMTIVTASSLPADQVAALLRREVARLDPDQAIADITPMQHVVAASTTQQQFTSSLLGVFAALATTLAVIGLYGVTTLFVNQRRHEFGIRMALGAQRSAVLLLVMRQGMKAILGGASSGCWAPSLAAGRSADCCSALPRPTPSRISAARWRSASSALSRVTSRLDARSPWIPRSRCVTIIGRSRYPRGSVLPRAFERSAIPAARVAAFS